MFNKSIVQVCGVAAVLSYALFIGGCGGEDKPQTPTATGNNDHGHTPDEHEHGHHHGEHHGTVVEIGEGAYHVELVHDGAAGKITAHVTGKDAKTPALIADAPVLNVKAKDGSKQFILQAVSADKDGKTSQFEIVDAEFKDGADGMPNLMEPLQGRLAMKVGGKTYNSDFKEKEHDH